MLKEYLSWESHGDCAFHERQIWGSGPWDDEPDKALWIDPKTGLDCMIVRNNLGCLCGYVGVKKGEPLYGVDYDKCGQIGDRIHGGLTYSEECRGRVAHTDYDRTGGSTYWWFGFDTAHSSDYVPGLILFNVQKPERITKYRRFDYVKLHTEGMAKSIRRFQLYRAEHA